MAAARADKSISFSCRSMSTYYKSMSTYYKSMCTSTSNYNRACLPSTSTQHVYLQPSNFTSMSTSMSTYYSSVSTCHKLYAMTCYWHEVLL